MLLFNQSKLRSKIIVSRPKPPASYGVEALEIRTLLTGAGTIVTVGAVGYNGTSPLQVTAGESVTLTADVKQLTNGTAVNADPTGTVTFYWDQTQGFPSVLIGQATASVVISPIYDTQYTGTFTLNPVAFLETDNFGDQLIIANYSGDSNIPAGGSFTPINNDENYPSTRFDPAQGYVPVDFATAVTSGLSVTVQPSPAGVSSKIDPPVVVSVLDNGNVDTTSDTAITASITPGGTGEGTLSGTTTVDAVAGVATFSDLAINKPGEYGLTFTDSDGGSTKSGSFQIGSGIKVRIQPTTTSPGDAIAPAVTVAVVDATGKPDTSADPTPITASLSSDSTGTGTLGGTLTATTVKGTATFKNLQIDKPGQYTLSFADTDGDTAPSTSFTVATGRLKFIGQIAKGIPGTALNPAVKVELFDSKGRLLTDVSSLVTLNITGVNASDPVSGNSVQLVNGVALFSNLKFAQPGDYTLTASDDEDDATAISKSISITGLHLVIRSQPGEVSTNAPLKYEVDLEDYKNRIVNDSTISLALALNTITGGANAALSSTADLFSGGKAVNAGSSPATITAPGTYTITFSPILTGSDVSYKIDPITSKQFNAVVYHLAFVKQPKTLALGYPLKYEVELEDYRDHIVVNARTDQLLFTLLPQNTGSTGTLSSGIDHLSGGNAINSEGMLTVSANGTYKLLVVDVPANAADAVASSVTSASFKIGLGIFG